MSETSRTIELTMLLFSYRMDIIKQSTTSNFYKWQIVESLCLTFLDYIQR